MTRKNKNKKQEVFNCDFNKNRRGELTTQQIVLLIILIASFAVILFFLFRLNLGKTTDAETCHNSIVQRGSGVLPKESIPLNCKTQYVCLTKDGTCEKMTSPQIEKVKTIDEVYGVLANQMADCWWMFGEGKLNYIQSDFQPELYCSICSQVAFDKSIDFLPNNQIDKKEFYNYLSNTKMSGKDISYLEYLAGLKNSQTIEDTLRQSNSQFGKPIQIDKQYYVMMGILSKVGLEKWGGVGAAGGAATTIGAILLTVGTGGLALIPIGIGTVVGGGIGYFVGTIFAGSSGNNYLSPTIIESNSADFASLNCSSIKTIG